MGAEENEVLDGADIFYVCKSALEKCKEQVRKGETIEKTLIDELTTAENLPDDAVMIPVDMRGVGDNYDDVEQMVEKLGDKGTAEAFIKAAEYFDANHDKEAEDERPKPMSAQEWRAVLEEDMDEESEEDLFEGEEEEMEEAEEEEGGDEPAAKKAKTD